MPQKVKFLNNRDLRPNSSALSYRLHLGITEIEKKAVRGPALKLGVQGHCPQPSLESHRGRLLSAFELRAIGLGARGNAVRRSCATVTAPTSATGWWVVARRAATGSGVRKGLWRRIKTCPGLCLHIQRRVLFWEERAWRTPKRKWASSEV